VGYVGIRLKTEGVRPSISTQYGSHQGSFDGGLRHQSSGWYRHRHNSSEESVSQIGDRCDNEMERELSSTPHPNEAAPTRRSRDISTRLVAEPVSGTKRSSHLAHEQTGIDIKDFDFEIDKKPASVALESRAEGFVAKS